MKHIPFTTAVNKYPQRVFAITIETIVFGIT